MLVAKLKARIKKNEGYSKIPYKDTLGFYTIGYGHLIKKNEEFYFKKKFKKKDFDVLFEDDFNNAYKNYINHFSHPKHTNKDKELLTEMIFQLGAKGLFKFKKMLHYVNNKQKYMACLEMMNSLWYLQTPKRVENLIYNYISK